ncbi:hypothetical protein CROQUDRAFT_135929 [Cronartium quercuum f. sp. fusiforme G11]|uniref:Uncharacterized protein n=1 Tax=Cronartium quercuum f. sp. fusiforme G11 TaxID=708437 RepID=A0A9P6NCV2_9BASI|nr:hypothetical protein CROQUDRAFT_135929 [Cronartium quercuum f. sp. fusiforme G11]
MSSGNLSKRQSEENQKLELGWLYCNEEELYELWAHVPATAEQELSHAKRAQELEARIKTQRAKIGDNAIVEFLSATQASDQELILDWTRQIHHIFQVGELGMSMTPSCFSLLRQIQPLPHVASTVASNENQDVAVVLEHEDEAVDDGEGDFIQGIDDDVV